MLVQLNYLKNHQSVDVGPLLGALCAEVERAGVDPVHLKVNLDWLQYKKNFRPLVDPRPYLLPDGSASQERELAIDVRRPVGDTIVPPLRQALTRLYPLESDGAPPVYLEEACRPSQSVIWAFNRTFWQHLSAWETTFQRGFLSALPGGVTDGTNPDFWRDRLTAFLDVLDDLQARGLLPEEIYVLEMGVGTGHQAKIWLDTFAALCAERGRDYLPRI